MNWTSNIHPKREYIYICVCVKYVQHNSNISRLKFRGSFPFAATFFYLVISRVNGFTANFQNRMGEGVVEPTVPPACLFNTSEGQSTGNQMNILRFNELLYVPSPSDYSSWCQGVFVPPLFCSVNSKQFDFWSFCSLGEISGHGHGHGLHGHGLHGDGLHDDHSGDRCSSGDHHNGDRIHGGRDVHSGAHVDDRPKSQSTCFSTHQDPIWSIQKQKHVPTHQLYSQNPATVVWKNRSIGSTLHLFEAIL